MTRGRVLGVVACVLVVALLWWLWSAPSGERPPTEPPVAEGDEPVVVVVTPTVVDRFIREPCNLVQGSGLFSVHALITATEKVVSAVSVSMGDLTLAEGEPGRQTARVLLGAIVPQTGLAVVAAGEGELGFGSEFVRSSLARIAKDVLLCANATDPAGDPLLRGWVLLESKKSSVLVVSVAGESLREALSARGSDVVVTAPGEAAAAALAAGRARADEIREPVGRAILLVHGTQDEAAAILEAAPGFDAAAAAHGPVLPESEPRSVNGVPLYYAGQGLRFAWRVLVSGSFEDRQNHRLARIGGELARETSPYREGLSLLARELKDDHYPRIVASREGRPADARGAYAHSEACKDCHAEEYEQHGRSAHARRSEALAGSAFAASTACLPCHVTAPYRVDGWMGPADESDFAAISCEACHGPAGTHVDFQDGSYGGVSFDVCYGCHLPDRTPGLDAAAFWARWGHGPPDRPDAAAGGGEDGEDGAAGPEDGDSEPGERDEDRDDEAEREDGPR